MTKPTDPLVAVSEAAPCPHCGAEMRRMDTGATVAFQHPTTDCWLAAEILLGDQVEGWNRRISHHAGMREALRKLIEQIDREIDFAFCDAEFNAVLSDSRQMLASLQPPQDEMRGWRPTETALTDNPVDLWVRNSFIGTEYRLADCWHDGTDWLDRNDERIIETVLAWMPLPAPPAALTSQGGEHG